MLSWAVGLVRCDECAHLQAYIQHIRHMATGHETKNMWDEGVLKSRLDHACSEDPQQWRLSIQAIETTYVF